MPTREEHLARVYRDALDAGLGPEGARVAAAIAVTEAGYEGAVGDRDRSALGSAGTFQFYFGTPERPGMGNAFAAAHGMGQQQARDYLSANPHAANRWALGGYLGNAIRAGLQKGLRGADLATYAQTVGQRSESPERSGANYAALWSGAQPAIEAGASPAPEPAPRAPSARRGPPAVTELLGLFAPGRAEAAELGDQPTPPGGAAVASEGDRPPSEFEPPSRFGGTPGTAPAAPGGRTGKVSPKLRTLDAQLKAANGRLKAAQAEVERLTGAQPAIDPADNPGETEAKQKPWRDALAKAEKAAAEAQGRIDDLEIAVAEEEEKAGGGPAAKKPRIKARDGSVWEQQENGDWEQIEDIPSGAAPTAPKASRTYKTPEGATVTETAPDVSSFGPLPAGVGTAAAMTPYEQQSAETARLNATTSALTAQIAQGRLSYDQAKAIFDYVVKQGAPVEEGGKLYRPGREPGNVNRQFFGESVQPYAVADAAAFFGRPELNRYVRGPYPYGAGPMSPQEYNARQAGGFQPGPTPAARVPAPAGPAPALASPLAASPDAATALLEQRHGEQAGGFSPQMLAALAAPAAGTSYPQFGNAAAVTAQGEALLRQTDQIRQMLLNDGLPPAQADRFARRYVREGHGMGRTLAQTPF